MLRSLIALGSEQGLQRLRLSVLSVQFLPYTRSTAASLFGFSEQTPYNANANLAK